METYLRIWEQFLARNCNGLKCDGCRLGEWCERMEKAKGELKNECSDKDREDTKLSNTCL